MLEEHITENIVKIGHEYYRQIVGIPQGSVLSAILCSFFYGDLERKKFKFTEDPDCVSADSHRLRPVVCSFILYPGAYAIDRRLAAGDY